MSTRYSPGRSPGSSRLHLGLGGVSRLRSSSSKKPPEPLRRAVADCLSSSSTAMTSTSGSYFLHGGSSAGVSEASRTLRDYLAAPSTTDLAYSVILEHTIAERERSPAVVSRCVSLLKRHLLRYKPSEELLQQIDRFCVNTIAEFDVSPNQRLSPWSKSLNQQSGVSAAYANNSPLPVSTFESAALVKSLNYVRSLVAQHIPKRSFQAAAFSGGFTASRQLLPTLSSLLSKSFNTQLSPANNGEPVEVKDTTALSGSNLTNFENDDVVEDLEYIAQDILKWRWPGELESPFFSAESVRAANPQKIRIHSFLEVGAAALLVGDMNAKLNSQPSHLKSADVPNFDQLLQPSSVTTATNSASARPHLKAITASKRTRLGPHQIWEESPVSTFRPRARPLFQYRHYSEQQPLRLNTLEIGEVITAVCMETSAPVVNAMAVSSKLSNNSGKPSMDVAVSVLIKLVIDMYVMDSRTAAPLALSMLEEMLSSPISASRARAFDLILNLGVHAHLLEPIMTDGTSTIEEEYGQESYIDNEAHLATQGKRLTESLSKTESSAINKFESWILGLLYEILLLLVQMEEKEESIWASALSCLLYFLCDRGKIHRGRLKGLDIRVVKALLEISRANSWAEVVHCKLICMLTNMFYLVSGAPMEFVSSTPRFLPCQVDLIGGIEFIFFEYSLAQTRNERRNLYAVLFEYVLHEANDICEASGVSEYGDDEIQALASLLILADAPEAFYISVRLGVEGIMEILRNSISAALCRYPNSERLNMLLEKITGKFDAIISTFTKLDQEFSHLKQITKTQKVLKSIDDTNWRSSDGMKVKLSWGTLHSLLHSERIACRQNGYIWLGDLLIAESSDGTDILSNIKNLQQRIALGDHDALVSSDVPLPILLMCGLLKSKNNFIRWGFLFVLERLLMRCKCLLDENKQHLSSGEGGGHAEGNSRLEKANAVIDIMNSALSLVAQINETNRINILKMCEILFSQLFLKVPLATALSSEDAFHKGKLFSGMDGYRTVDASEHDPQLESRRLEDFVQDIDPSCGFNMYETASMAALLLRGQAVVPMQLIARVPAVLFYWPLIQLAGAAADNIALGVAVGSKGRGNLPGAASDIRATLLLLLIGKCTADSAAFQEVGGQEFFRELLDDTDSRVAYYSSAFLLKRMMTEEPENYQRMLQSLVLRAQQSNNEKLLENPYLQMRGILQLSNE